MRTDSISRTIGRIRVEIEVGDISDQPDVDALVNCTNSRLQLGSGVSGAIAGKAGFSALEKACNSLAPIKPGEAVITSGFHLPNTHIIHCCGPKFGAADALSLLEQTYFNILELAEQNQLTSLAIPAISTGQFGFPIHESARIAFDAVTDFSPEAASLRLIRFVLFEKKAADQYSKRLLAPVSYPTLKIPLEIPTVYSIAEFDRIQNGFLGDHDTKWFMFYVEPWFLIYRGNRRFGRCHFGLRFDQTAEGIVVEEAWAEGLDTPWQLDEMSAHVQELIDDRFGLLQVGEDKKKFGEVDTWVKRDKVALSASGTSLLSPSDAIALAERLINLANAITKKPKGETRPIFNNRKDFAHGAVIGALAGDAAGATLEFLQRKPTQAEVQNAMQMVGGGVWKTAPGQVTDDGELTLALAHALAGQSEYDPRRSAYFYRKWYLSNPFDVGHATTNALGSGDLKSESLFETVLNNALKRNSESKANGSLMRASVLGVWSATVSTEDAIKAAKLDAQLTHPNPACQWAGVAYVLAIRHLMLQPGDAKGAFNMAKAALRNEEANEVLGWLHDAHQEKLPACHPSPGFIRIAFTYAFYHLLKLSSYPVAIAETLSGGGDTDTNACIVGGLLGALHGSSAIPEVMKSAVKTCDTKLGRPRPLWLQTSQMEGVMAGLGV